MKGFSKVSFMEGAVEGAQAHHISHQMREGASKIIWNAHIIKDFWKKILYVRT